MGTSSVSTLRAPGSSKISLFKQPQYLREEIEAYLPQIKPACGHKTEGDASLLPVLSKCSPQEAASFRRALQEFAGSSGEVFLAQVEAHLQCADCVHHMLGRIMLYTDNNNSMTETHSDLAYRFYTFDSTKVLIGQQHHLALMYEKCWLAWAICRHLSRERAGLVQSDGQLPQEDSPVLWHDLKVLSPEYCYKHFRLGHFLSDEFPEPVDYDRFHVMDDPVPLRERQAVKPSPWYMSEMQIARNTSWRAHVGEVTVLKWWLTEPRAANTVVAATGPIHLQEPASRSTVLATVSNESALNSLVHLPSTVITAPSPYPQELVLDDEQDKDLLRLIQKPSNDAKQGRPVV